MKQLFSRHGEQSSIDLEFNNLYRELSNYGGVPAFSVHRGGTDSANYAGGSYQKLLFTTAEYDTHGQFDLSLSRFTPRISGIYQLNAAYYWKTSEDAKDFYINFYKNGISYKEIGNITGAGLNVSIGGSIIIKTTNPGDYYEIFVLHQFSGNRVISGTASLTYWQGTRIG